MAIITNRKSGFIQRGGRMKRESLWLFQQFSSNTLAASATAALATSLNAAALALRPFTVVRTHMNWQVISDQSAATEVYIGNIGMAIVSTQAVAIGVTALPTPATDLGSDLFFMIQQWISEFTLVGTDVTTDVVSRQIDSKAMRRVNEGQDLVQTVEAGIGGAGIVIRTVGRQLIKLH